jgi:O-6-methylguanine DNA methyltransferase
VSVGCSEAGVARVRYGQPRAARPQRGRGQADNADPAARVLAEAACRELTEYFCGDREVFGVAVDWTAVSGLQRYVLSVLAGSVGYGHTISYGALARAAGLTAADPAPSPTAADQAPSRTAADQAPSPTAADQAPSPTAADQAPSRTAARPAPGQAGDKGAPPPGLAARTVGTIMGGNPIPVIVPCHRVVASDGLGGYSGGAGVEVKRWLLILEGALPPTLDWQPMTRPG